MKRKPNNTTGMSQHHRHVSGPHRAELVAASPPTASLPGTSTGRITEVTSLLVAEVWRLTLAAVVPPLCPSIAGDAAPSDPPSPLLLSSPETCLRSTKFLGFNPEPQSLLTSLTCFQADSRCFTEDHQLSELVLCGVLLYRAAQCIALLWIPLPLFCFMTPKYNHETLEP